MHGLPYPDLPEPLRPVASAMPNLIEVDDLTFATLVAFLSSNPRVRLVPSVVMHEPGGREKYNRAKELHRHLKAVREFNQLRRARQAPPNATAPVAPVPTKPPKPKSAAKGGRPTEYDVNGDAAIYRMWIDGGYKKFAEMERVKDLPAQEIKEAVGRHRKRLDSGSDGKTPVE